MPDDEGYLLPGDLPVGSYAAVEADLGEKLCGPLGFSAPEVEFEDDGVEFVASGFGTAEGRVVFQVRRAG